MMRDIPSENNSADNDLSVKAEEYLEVITTEDERIKIIGEELANDTGRAIFGKISQGIASPNDLAKTLNISLPLINWHINRLLSVGLVKVEKTELSSKNKQVKYYGPVKTALVIIPPERPVAIGSNAPTRKESVLIKLRQYMASLIAFVAGAPIIYSIQKSMYAGTDVNFATTEPSDVPSMMMKSTQPLEESARTSDTLTAQAQPVFPDEPTMILIAIIGAAAIAIAAFFITRFYIKRKKSLVAKHKN